MQFQYITYVWPLIVSALISLPLGIYALLRQRNAIDTMSLILSNSGSGLYGPELHSN